MCGYACVGCGRCGKKPARPPEPIETIPGYCKACGNLNGPSSKRCKTCGEELVPVYFPERA